MKLVPVSQTFATVDDEDYEYLSQFSWHESREGRSTYAQARIKGRTVRMHNLITGLTGADHVDCDGLNNQRSNLRPATGTQNQGNRRKNLTGVLGRPTSQYKGVCWNKFRGAWHARLRFQGKLIQLGYFSNEEDAARAYDAAALLYFGEFARPNFLD